jgi:hypothetical protein
LVQKVTELERELDKAAASAGDRQVCGKLAMQVLHSVASTGSEIAETSYDAEYLTMMARLVDEINIAATAESGPSSSAANTPYLQLANLLCRRDANGEAVLFQVISRLLGSRRDGEQQQQPQRKVVAIEDGDGKQVLDFLLPLCARLARSMCNGGRWRTQIDFNVIDARSSQLDSAVDEFFSDFANMDDLKRALCDPLECGDAFMSWIVHQAIACIGINDQFANATKSTLDKERRAKQEALEASRKLVQNVELHVRGRLSLFIAHLSFSHTQVTSLVKKINSNPDAPLYADDAQMLLALLEGASDAAERVSPFLVDESIPVGVKNCINDLQLCLTFLGKITMAMHTNTYAQRGQEKESGKRPRPPPPPPSSPTYGNN